MAAVGKFYPQDPGQSPGADRSSCDDILFSASHSSSSLWSSSWDSARLSFQKAERRLCDRPGCAGARKDAEQNPGAASGKGRGIRQAYHPNTVFGAFRRTRGRTRTMTEAEAMYEYHQGPRQSPNHQMLLEEQSCQHLRKSGIQQAPDPGTGSENDAQTTPGRDGSVGLSVPSRTRRYRIRVGIITSNFHVLRAKAIARKDRHPRHHRHRRQSRTRCCFYTSASGNASRYLKDKFVGNM